MKDFFRKITDLIFASFLWFFVSLLGLLVTMGAATTAMFRVSFQVLKKDEPTNVLKEFFKTFKESFVESSIIWFIVVIIGSSLFFFLRYSFLTSNTILIIIGLSSAFELAIFTIYVFPIIATFESENIFMLIRNTFLISHRSLWLNIKLVGSLAFLVLLIFTISSFFIILIALVYGILIAFHLKPYFEEIKNKIIEEQRQANKEMVV